MNINIEHRISKIKRPTSNAQRSTSNERAWLVREIAGLTGKKVESLESLSGGKNSRVWFCRCGDGSEWAVKHYHHSTHDKRDRLGTEFKAFGFLRDRGVTVVPCALFRNDGLGLGIYSYVRGERASKITASESDARQMLGFVRVLWALSKELNDVNFSPASDACFSGRAIAEQINTRLERLTEASVSEFPVQESRLKHFLSEILKPKFHAFTTRAKKKLSAGVWEQDIPFERRILSPSDFGLHNAVRDENGDLTFIDFEYFGWDDPVKLISDFLLHPAMNLSNTLKNIFFHGFFGLFSDDSGLKDRFHALYPLFGLKWCTILLNEFLDNQMERRLFSGDCLENRRFVLDRQLNKAEAMVKGVMESNAFLDQVVNS